MLILPILLATPLRSCILRDEIYKIAAEALRNSFRHGRVRRIEVELRYDEERFRLRVCDDERGINAAILPGKGVRGTTACPV